MVTMFPELPLQRYVQAAKQLSSMKQSWPEPVCWHWPTPLVVAPSAPTKGE